MKKFEVKPVKFFFVFDKISGSVLNKIDECESHQVRDNLSKNVSEIIHLHF